MKYRKKPEYVEASFFDGSNWDDVVQEMGWDVMHGYENCRLAGYYYVRKLDSKDLTLISRANFHRIYEEASDKEVEEYLGDKTIHLKM